MGLTPKHKNKGEGPGWTQRKGFLCEKEKRKEVMDFIFYRDPHPLVEWNFGNMITNVQ